MSVNSWMYLSVQRLHHPRVSYDPFSVFCLLLSFCHTVTSTWTKESVLPDFSNCRPWSAVLATVYCVTIMFLDGPSLLFPSRLLPYLRRSTLYRCTHRPHFIGLHIGPYSCILQIYENIPILGTLLNSHVSFLCSECPCVVYNRNTCRHTLGVA